MRHVATIRKTLEPVEDAKPVMLPHDAVDFLRVEDWERGFFKDLRVERIGEQWIEGVELDLMRCGPGRADGAAAVIKMVSGIWYVPMAGDRLVSFIQ